MQFVKASSASVALIAALWAGTASADLTAGEAWTSLRDLLVASGYKTTAQESLAGNTLTVSNAVFSIDIPDGQGTARINFGTMTFVEQGDGSVAVKMPGVIPFEMDMVTETGQPLTMGYSIIQENPDLVFSGSPGDIEQSYTADSVGVKIDSLDIPDEDVTADMVQVDFSLTNLASITRIGAGTPRPMTFTGSAGGLRYGVKVAVPDEGGMTMSGDLRDLTVQGGGALPVNPGSGDLMDMLAAGYSVHAQMAHGGGAMSMSGEDQGQKFTADSTSAGGSLSVLIDAKRLSYTLGQRDGSLTITSSGFPVPIQMDLKELAAGLTLPIQKSDTPQDFAFRLNLSDFNVSDLIWSMFDAGSVLPRDPASLLVDVSGTATVLANILDPNAAAEMEAGGDAPGEVNSLDIKAMLLKIAGAELTGKGAFTFDNTDLRTFGGAPRPAGALDLSLTGANALLDKLQQLGFLSPQDAGGARMMMGLLAVPGDTPDSLKSRIEINEQGHVLANGQRIQ
ncbi:MAG: DUF2125 domain-containing protein [Marinibacterium sp.]